MNELVLSVLRQANEELERLNDTRPAGYRQGFVMNLRSGECRDLSIAELIRSQERKARE